MMNYELDEALCKDFPLLFSDRHESMEVTAMCWGFDCDDGWEPLIRELAGKLEPLIQKYIDEFPNDEYHRAVQVKEKFGGLRVYMSKYTNEIDIVIDEFEERSFEICETCGRSPAILRDDTSWLKTLCDECHEKRNKND